jgi:phage gp36-like protein
MAYASPDDLVTRYDTRVIGALIDDAGVQVSDDQFATDPIVLEMLEDATGTINAHALMGGRYTVADLQGLTADAQAFLRRMCCDLAMGYLHERRGRDAGVVPGYTRALTMLKALKEGGVIFATQAAIDAGKPVRVVLDANKTLVASNPRIFGKLAADPTEPQPKGFS